MAELSKVTLSDELQNAVRKIEQSGDFQARQKEALRKLKEANEAVWGRPAEPKPMTQPEIYESIKNRPAKLVPSPGDPPGTPVELYDLATKLAVSNRRAVLDFKKRQQEATAAPVADAPEPIKRKRGRPTKWETDARRDIIQRISPAIKGRAYFEELDRQKLPMRMDWKRRGCPKTYADAYEDPYWCHVVQAERTKFKNR